MVQDTSGIIRETATLRVAFPARVIPNLFYKITVTAITARQDLLQRDSLRG